MCGRVPVVSIGSGACGCRLWRLPDEVLVIHVKRFQQVPTACCVLHVLRVLRAACCVLRAADVVDVVDWHRLLVVCGVEYSGTTLQE